MSLYEVRNEKRASSRGGEKTCRVSVEKTPSQVQIAAVCVATGREFSEFVMPVGEVQPGAARVHGLTRAALSAKGARPFEEVWPRVVEFLAAAPGELVFATASQLAVFRILRWGV